MSTKPNSGAPQEGVLRRLKHMARQGSVRRTRSCANISGSGLEGNGKGVLQGHKGPRRRRSILRRVEILRQVNTFSTMTEKQIERAAATLRPMWFDPGEVVIQQGEEGAEFFIIESGAAVVTHKLRPEAHDEDPRVLARLDAGQHFGEIALVTCEKRTASVHAGDNGLHVLSMSKDTFKNILSSAKVTSWEDSRTARGRATVATIPIFRSLEEGMLDKLVRAMRIMQYDPDTYICSQGSTANSFHVILEGQCSVTVADRKQPGGEHEVSTLNEDDYFGEVALIDPTQPTRSANVISLSSVTTMSLSKTEFVKILGNMKEKLLEHSAMRALASPQFSKLKSAKDIISGRFYKIARLVLTSLRKNSYSHLFKQLGRSPRHLRGWGGATVAQLVLGIVTPTAAQEHLRQMALSAGNKEPAARTDNEIALLVALTRPGALNSLAREHMSTWPSYQYADFCRQLRLRKFEAGARIFEYNAYGKTAYVVLRGAVILDAGKRVTRRRGSTVDDKLRVATPGEYFGEQVLKGMHNRPYQAVALSNVELLEVEENNYKRVCNHGLSAVPVDAKFHFLQDRVALFRNWDVYKLYRFASQLDHQIFAKGKIILKRTSVSSHLFFIKSGTVATVFRRNPAKARKHAIIPALDSPTHHAKELEDAVVLSHLRPGEFFGESGILSHGHSRSDRYREHTDMVAITLVEVLTLDESNYRWFDRKILQALASSRNSRVDWHRERVSTSLHSQAAVAAMDPGARPKSSSANQAKTSLRRRVDEFKEQQFRDTAARTVTASTSTPKLPSMQRSSRSTSTGEGMLLTVGSKRPDPHMPNNLAGTTSSLKPFAHKPSNASYLSKPDHWFFPPSQAPSNSSATPILTASASGVNAADTQLAHTHNSLHQAKRPSTAPVSQGVSRM